MRIGVLRLHSQQSMWFHSSMDNERGGQEKIGRRPRFRGGLIELGVGIGLLGLTFIIGRAFFEDEWDGIVYAAFIAPVFSAGWVLVGVGIADLVLGFSRREVAWG